MTPPVYDPQWVLSENLRYLIAKHHTTIKDMARKSGASYMVIQNAAEGIGPRGPQLATLDAIAGVFHMDAWQLIQPRSKWEDKK